MLAGAVMVEGKRLHRAQKPAMLDRIHVASIVAACHMHVKVDQTRNDPCLGVIPLTPLILALPGGMHRGDKPIFNDQVVLGQRLVWGDQGTAVYECPHLRPPFQIFGLAEREKRSRRRVYPTLTALKR
jgi:hypothetical protein